MKKLIFCMLLVSGQAFGNVFTCSCKVQRSDGSVGEATVTVVGIPNEHLAVNAAKAPCYKKAKQQISDFETPYTEYYNGGVTCEAGQVIVH